MNRFKSDIPIARRNDAAIRARSAGPLEVRT